MARWRLMLLGLLVVVLAACGGATTTSNQSLADPTAAATASGAAAPSSAAQTSAAPRASAAPFAPATSTVSRAGASAPPSAPASAAPAGTTAPTASRAPSAVPSAAASGAVPQPNGTIPAEWQVFRGPKEYPFVMAYPPGWTVDESYFPEQTIIFFVGPSGNTDEESVAIIWSSQQTESNIDVLLDDFYQQRTPYCDREGVEYNEYRQISDATFAILGTACDQGGVLFFLQFAAGLKAGDQWDIEMRTTYERKEEFRRTIFDPMLASMNVYALIP